MVRWNLVSFVARSDQRKKILALTQNPITPTDIANKLDTHLTQVSRTLRQFKERKLVECLTPKERMSKYYRITKLKRCSSANR